MIVILIILLEIKHVIADYFLQSDFMGIGKRLQSGWLYPLFLHSFEHGVGTLLAVLICTRNVYWAIMAGLFDLTTHMIIDRIKSSPYMFGDYYDTKWWNLLTLIDQGLHHIVIWLIVFWIYKNL